MPLWSAGTTLEHDLNCFHAVRMQSLRKGSHVRGYVPSLTKVERGGADLASATPSTTVVACETNGLQNAPSVLWHIAERHDAALALTA